MHPAKPGVIAAFLSKIKMQTEIRETEPFMSKINFPSGDFTIADLEKANPAVTQWALQVFLGWAIMGGAIEFAQNEENAPAVYRKKRG
jgi:hypothetical protein